MPRLVTPTVDLQVSFLQAVTEFGSELPYADLDVEQLTDIREFGRFVRRLRDEALPGTPRPRDRVPATTLWWVEGDTFLGRVSIRHTLDTEFLAVYGGHIGYEVRPSARRQGHATRMLAAALPVAASLGIDPALVTCDATNVASRRVIERNGGSYSDTRNTKLRFWVPTLAAAPRAGLGLA